MIEQYRLLITDAEGGVHFERVVTGALMRLDEHPEWRHSGFVDATPCFDVRPSINTKPRHDGGAFSDGAGGMLIVQGIDSDFIGLGPFPYIATVEPAP